ncbi:MAG: GNAT family protein [Lautropia sp.]|nr:GNAT family protein [Lautropia sp.]
MSQLVRPVVLAANGIRLEPLALSHEAGLRDAAADGELWTIRVTSVPEPDQTRAYIEQALEGRQAGTRFAFAVIETPGGRVLGSTSYHDIVAAIPRVEIGYTWYRRSVQRTHVNTTAKLLLLRHAFDVLQCPVVGWRTDGLNLASQQAIERLGARKDGVIRRHAPRRDGSIRDTVMYSLLREEWPALEARLMARLAQGGRPWDEAACSTTFTG